MPKTFQHLQRKEKSQRKSENGKKQKTKKDQQKAPKTKNIEA